MFFVLSGNDKLELYESLHKHVIARNKVTWQSHKKNYYDFFYMRLPRFARNDTRMHESFNFPSFARNDTNQVISENILFKEG